jgi:anti-sigma factor RsiW
MNAEEASRLLQAYADGELDPAAALELEAELVANPALRAAHERTRALSAAIRGKADYHAAPPALVSRIRASLPGEAATPSPRRGWLMPAGAFAAAAILAIALAMSWQRTAGDDRLAADLIASHARATLGQRMIDVASSDRHTVKPWLSARLPFSPPVEDFAKDGFPLTGGRVDYAGGRPVAVLVYQRRKHVVEAFVWPGSAPARSATHDGLNLESFSRNGMTYWLVSDLEHEELAELARLF